MPPGIKGKKIILTFPARSRPLVYGVLLFVGTPVRANMAIFFKKSRDTRFIFLDGDLMVKINGSTDLKENRR
jgi:hypothetical protein